MEVVIINGTGYRGCTYQMKELLKGYISELMPSVQYTEFVLPDDFPHFCVGCKNCFFKGEEFCPHSAEVAKIWNSVLRAELLVFIYPMYVMRVPGHLKALLDHWGVYWISHRPDPRMFGKKALVITQGIGAPTKGALRDVTNALQWMGLSEIRSKGFKLMEGIIWSELSQKRKSKIEQGLRRLAEWSVRPTKGKLRMLSWLIFQMCKAMQKSLHKKSDGTLSLDTQYWLDQGWIGGESQPKSPI